MRLQPETVVFASPPAFYEDLGVWSVGKAMRLHKLTLKNFRGFENLELDLDPASARPVVLVGVNGAGKSSSREFATLRSVTGMDPNEGDSP